MPRASTRSWSRCRPIAVVAAPESTLVDELVAVAYSRDLAPLVEYLNAEAADVIGVGCVLASMADIGDLLMYCANEPSTLAALHPVPLRA